ncbi:MAG: SPOR domain-containing protein [Desulfosalsimonas sp.]|uniref:SPOR domain-containing protein n=1 Tax=Desulfosalsimonas sp. TaxID=3073848 RepID=UPI0039709B03
MGGSFPKTNSFSSRGGASGWVLMIFIASGCMFILGVLVGRNTAPVHFDMQHLDEKLAQLQSSVLSEPGEQQTSNDRIPEDISFEFYDRLREKSQVDEYAQGRPRVLAPKHPKPDLAEIRVQPPRSKPETEPMPAQKESGHPVQIAAEQPSPSASGKLFAIQVASLRDRQKAETVEKKYKDKGYPAFTQKAAVEGQGRWHRVRIGPYTNRSQAENDLVRLQKAGVDAMLLPHEPGF